MSDLSVNTTPEGVVTPPRKAAVSENKPAVRAESNASVGKDSVADVSNYVTSPKGVVDPESGVYVLQYRDGATGEVLNQYPSEKAVDAYKRGAANGDVAAATSTANSGTVQSTTSGSISAPSGSVESVGVPSQPVGTTSTAGQGSVTPTSTSVDV